MHRIRAQIPNALSNARLVIAPAIVAATPRRAPALGLVAGCAATDVLDGFLARRWQVTTNRGASLDSAADGVFFASLLVAVMRSASPEDRRRLAVAATPIVAIRATSTLVGLSRFGRLGAIHSRANKAAGLAVVIGGGACLAGCRVTAMSAAAGLALVAAVEELVLMARMPSFDADRVGW